MGQRIPGQVEAIHRCLLHSATDRRRYGCRRAGPKRDTDQPALEPSGASDQRFGKRFLPLDRIGGVDVRTFRSTDTVKSSSQPRNQRQDLLVTDEALTCRTARRGIRFAFTVYGYKVPYADRGGLGDARWRIIGEPPAQARSSLARRDFIGVQRRSTYDSTRLVVPALRCGADGSQRLVQEF